MLFVLKVITDYIKMFEICRKRYDERNKLSSMKKVGNN